VKFGVKGGINMSTHLKHFRYSSEQVSRLDLNPLIKLGYQTGFIIRKPISPSWRLQTEPSIMLLGARYEESFTLQGFDFETDSRTKLLYLRLPLLVQLSTVPPERTVYGRQFAETTYHLTGGLFAGYLLDARFTGTNSGEPLGIPFIGDFSNEIKSQYSEYDGGLLLGVGFEHGYGKKIGLEARVQLSIYDSGDAPELYFKPQNLAVTFAAYILL